MCKKLFRILILLPVGFLADSSTANAQTPIKDTLKITIKQAEDLFIKNNLQLISQRYNVEIADAQVITARLFSNPDFNYNNGIAGRAEPNPTSEQSAGISQLIITAGKRNKNIKLAKIGVEQARFQFFDLVRTLKNTLRTSFYTVYYQRLSAKVYQQEINSLSKTFTVFKNQYAKGNIAQKEVLRIQSQLYSLQVEYNGLQTSIDSTESQIKLFLRIQGQTTIVPLVPDDIDGKDILAPIPYQRLLDSAYQNRYDLKYSKATVDYNGMNLQLQKLPQYPTFPCH